MHIKRDISNWNIIIILSVLIGAGNPELLSTLCLLSHVFGVLIGRTLNLNYCTQQANWTESKHLFLCYLHN